ncbi:MAG: hypothetical protein Q9225_003580 [Loekoesia sp. 1 TL-2023]
MTITQSLITVAVWLIWVLASYVEAEPKCHHHYLDLGEDWFGSPDYEACRRLLFGNNDLTGMAAIDNRPHAFIPPGAQQEQESDTEWANKVEMPKFWANAGCKIALLLPETVNIHGTRRIYRDTGEWLAIAEAGQGINDVCVRSENSGGTDETGEPRGVEYRRTRAEIPIKGTTEDFHWSYMNPVRDKIGR